VLILPYRDGETVPGVETRGIPPQQMKVFSIDKLAAMVSDVPNSLHQVKAEFFKTLGHPARIRVLELLAERDRTVGELLPEIGLEASNLSQQLGVLRRAGVVMATKEGNTVVYSIASPVITELLAVARRALTGLLSDQVALLDDLRAGR
jgi:ArsR family transcriptional regulator